MPITKQWPGGATNATPTSFSLPLNNELNWLQLTSFLQSLADSAQGTTFQKFKVRVVTASPDTISATADCILAVNVAGAVTINLPAGAEKQIFFIVDSSGAAATNNITITPNGSETVRGGASLVLNKNYQGVVLAFTGTDWKAFGPFTTPGSITDSDFTGQLSTAKGGTGQNSTATFPTSGTVATVPAAGVVKSSGTALTSSNVNLTSEVTGTLPVANGGSGQSSKTPAFDALSPLTTKGDIIAFDGTNNVRFPVGANGTVLTANSATATGLQYTTPLINPMTTQGDIIYGGVGGAATRLPAGTTGQALVTNGTAAPSWGNGLLPLGAVIATFPHMTGAYSTVATTNPDSLGFVLCQGQTLASGPMSGQVVPNINNNAFLRGNSSSSATLNSSATRTLAAANIPSLTSTGSVTSTGSTVATSTQSTNVDHVHSMSHSHSYSGATSTDGAHIHTEATVVQDIANGSAPNRRAFAGGAPYVSSGGTAWIGSAGSSHAHGFGFSVDLTANTGSSTQPTHSHPISSLTVNSGQSVSVTSTGTTGTAFNIEPTYINCVYLMRAS